MRCVLTRCAGVSWRIERIGKALDGLGHSKSQNFVCTRFWLKPPARASLPSKSIRKQKTGITHNHMHKEFEMLSVPSAFDLEGTISPVHWRWTVYNICPALPETHAKPPDAATRIGTGKQASKADLVQMKQCARMSSNVVSILQQPKSLQFKNPAHLLTIVIGQAAWNPLKPYPGQCRQWQCSAFIMAQVLALIVAKPHLAMTIGPQHSWNDFTHLGKNDQEMMDTWHKLSWHPVQSSNWCK